MDDATTIVGDRLLGSYSHSYTSGLARRVALNDHSRLVADASAEDCLFNSTDRLGKYAVADT